MSAIAVSTFANATNITPRDMNVETVLKSIRSGGKKLKGQIQQIRNRFQAERAITGDYKKAKLAIAALKKQLPGVTWSGTFSQRANEKLIQHSGLLCADLDSLGDRLDQVRKKLQSSPHLYALFLSPTGDGLKAVFRVPADQSKHAGGFLAIKRHVFKLCGSDIDEKSKDKARLCFLSHDPDIYINENGTEIEPLAEPEKPKRTLANGTVNLSERQCIAVELLGQIEWTSETEGYCDCPNKAAHTTGDGKRDCKIWVGDKPSIYCFHNSCLGVIDGLNHALRSRIGKTEYQPKVLRSEAQTADDVETSTDLTSLCSPALDEFPAPLEKAAFHGLAGAIVRRIEPHTESDRAALLVQFLIAFGNVIGRTAHAMADGARHGANLFLILVGQTSKARKGTAWRHERRLYEHVDKHWTETCIANGLSSGEGLIWAVRDPIAEKRPVKEKGHHTGEYETLITDHGVSDKRLLVVEEEFANVFKVMTREGNTLSPIIRSAWDSGTLRTLTKNSPARATNAHISIIGHITREELRRLLTETESANGFGNRFLFVAVKRGKCLPEGGGAPAMADLVERLKRAVEFEKNARELNRDDATRELWAQIYPALSEGKLGLLGAITARAEAQVLRLSLLYALLDCSARVQLEHLRAALAVWRYCEDSARWLFQTGTGNKNADRILGALIATGEKGLTKWEITSEVFSRHATKFEIDEALRLLHRLRLAQCKREATATRSAERWFYKPPLCELCEELRPKNGKTGDTSHSSHLPPLENSSTSDSDVGAVSGELETMPTGILEL
jgi:hypothetical protein